MHRKNHPEQHSKSITQTAIINIVIMTGTMNQIIEWMYKDIAKDDIEGVTYWLDTIYIMAIKDQELKQEHKFKKAIHDATNYIIRTICK